MASIASCGLQARDELGIALLAALATHPCLLVSDIPMPLGQAQQRRALLIRQWQERAALAVRSTDPVHDVCNTAAGASCSAAVPPL